MNTLLFLLAVVELLRLQLRPSHRLYRHFWTTLTLTICFLAVGFTGGIGGNGYYLLICCLIQQSCETPRRDAACYAAVSSLYLLSFLILARPTTYVPQPDFSAAVLRITLALLAGLLATS